MVSGHPNLWSAAKGPYALIAGSSAAFHNRLRLLEAAPTVHSSAIYDPASPRVSWGVQLLGALWPDKLLSGHLNGQQSPWGHAAAGWLSRLSWRVHGWPGGRWSAGQHLAAAYPGRLCSLASHLNVPEDSGAAESMTSQGLESPRVWSCLALPDAHAHCSPRLSRSV